MQGEMTSELLSVKVGFLGSKASPFLKVWVRLLEASWPGAEPWLING